MTAENHGSIALAIDGPVATIALDRPAKLNALTPEMLEQLFDLLGDVRRSEARVVVVRGNGDRAFCVGADINRFADLNSVQMLDWTGRGHRVFDALAALPQPSIAVLHGPVFGGGLELALACDLRIASDTATFGLPEVGLGTVPGWGGTERLVELAGRSRAKEVILARRTLDARTALEWGVVNQVADPAGLEAAAAELAERICAAGPVAVRIAKTLIDAAADGAPSRVLEQLGGAVTSATQDLSAGITAFRSRTTPTFSGN
ncbi:MAG: enoyl-CoA hydratase/isomerase family protein [Actinobacteria bacterium]|nr:enoyl-CoA hydratase/isomerase family protein [Actinomycetota bacterium]